MTDGNPLLQHLSTVLLSRIPRGVPLHLNNLENFSGANVEPAGDVPHQLLRNSYGALQLHWQKPWQVNVVVERLYSLFSSVAICPVC